MEVNKANAPLIHAEATAAAVAATDEYMRDVGAHPFNCGFSWVVIKPARGPFVNWLKTQDIGGPKYGGGYQIWNPSGNPTQDMTAKVAGTAAYAAVLSEHGIDCYIDSRMD